ncbi:Na+/H+ antiporter NhaC family protein [Staphylospora marina]|uniref:Na+/H+ antiporter NhaC family protein n=1 Tax=Staphylospora marina TaxID=2490858 RepID=UPI000F5BB592|nr:Na+/H+ antiporter NhaC family protein [Staphylospora marina]
MCPSPVFSGRELGGLFAITVTGILVAAYTGVPLLVGLLPGLILLWGMCLRKGVSGRELFGMSRGGAMRTREVLIILLLVSILLPLWDSSGTVDQLVGLFLGWLSKDWFLTCSFVFMMMLSMLLGTSVGSLSALGIPLLSVAAAWKLPPELVAGALVSGAFVGDRTSPFSGTHQLLADMVEVPVRKLFRIMLPTTALAVFISLMFFLWQDWTLSRVAPGEAAAGPVELSWLHGLPPALLLLPVLFRKPVKYGFVLSAAAALWMSLDRGVPPGELLMQLWEGSEKLGGGVRSMLPLLLFIFMTGAFNGVLEGLNMVRPFLQRWLRNKRSPFSLAWRTVVASGLIAATVCNQTMPIILTGRSFLDHWKTTRSREELARVMGDSAILFPGMIPWNLLAILFVAVIGIPALSWLPYAVFIWSLPLITLAVSAGMSVKRASRDDQPASGDGGRHQPNIPVHPTKLDEKSGLPE